MYNIVSDLRSFSFDDAMYILKIMCSDVISNKYACVRNVIFNENIDYSHVGYRFSGNIFGERSHPYVSCTIGIRDLIENMDSRGFVRDVDFVWKGKQIEHEARHVYQMQELYQKPLSGYDLDMARIDAVANAFDGYNRYMYRYMPSEIDADICGFTNVVAYFDSILPELDSRSCLVRHVCETGDWRGIRRCHTYDDILQSLEDIRYEYKYRPRNIIINDKDETNLKIMQRHCPGWIPVIESFQEKKEWSQEDCENADRQLFSAAMDINTSRIDHHAGLDDEVKLVRKLYPSKLGIGGRLLSSVIRSGNKRDEAICDRIAIAESIVDNIPAENDRQYE